jgi:hypothetical protein
MKKKQRRGAAVRRPRSPGVRKMRAIMLETGRKLVSFPAASNCPELSCWQAASSGLMQKSGYETRRKQKQKMWNVRRHQGNSFAERYIGDEPWLVGWLVAIGWLVVWLEFLLWDNVCSLVVSCWICN